MEKSILILLAFVLIAFVACNMKTADKTKETITETTNVTEEKTTPEEPAEKRDIYVMASLKKTPCYGKCPVFEAKIYNDGTAEYKGKMFVDRVGNYTARVDDVTLKSIKDTALEAGYFDFYNEYPTGDVQIADLPTTITSLRIGDQIKTITNKYQGPEELKNYEKFLSKLVDGLEWTKVAEDSKK